MATTSPHRELERSRITLLGLVAAAVLLAAGLPGDASAESRDTTKDIFVSAIIGHTPIAIWSDGDTVWGPDMVNDHIYAYDLDTRQRDKPKEFNTLYTSGNTSPTGVWSDGDTMWVADIVDIKIYAYDMDTKARDSSKDFDTLEAASNDWPRGIWSDGTTMWVVDEEDAKIYAYNMDTKARDSSKDFDTLSAAGNTEPRGIWSNDDTVWVADYDDAKIYAYNMTTKARDSSNDFDKLAAAGNTSPYGVWSDGNTFWISDTIQNAILAYDPDTDAAAPTSNAAPVANAGEPFAAKSGDTATLNGTASSDSDGDTLTYSWMSVLGPDTTITNPTTSSPTFTAPEFNQDEAIITYPDPGTLEVDWFSSPWSDVVFMLQVSDGWKTDIDTVVVSVTPPAGILSTDAGQDQTVLLGDTVTLHGSVRQSITTGTGVVLTGAVPEDTVSYEWTQLSGTTVTLSNYTASNPTFTAPDAPARLFFWLNATDGTQSTTDTVTIIVVHPNRAPTANAGQDQTINVNQTVTLNGAGSTDPDGDTLTYTWSQTSGDTVTLSDTAASSPTFTAPASASTLAFQLNVTDGTLHSTDTVTITVQVNVDDNSDATSIQITHVDGGSGFVTFTDGMTVNTDMPRFRGTSSGYDSVTLQVQNSTGTITQIGTGTGVNDDGSFQRGRTTLDDGTYTILVGSVQLGTITVDTSSSTTVSSAPSVSITQIDTGSGFVTFTDGMTVNTDMPRFRGTSSGYDSIMLQVQNSTGTITQIGTGTGVNDDGSFQRGRTTLNDGTYSIFVNSNSGTILGTFTVSTGN